MNHSDLRISLDPIQLRLFELREQVRQIADERRRLEREKRKLIAKGKKRCPRCKFTMKTEQFFKDKSKWDNLSIYCRECKGAMVKARAA